MNYDILIIKVHGHEDDCYNVWANCDAHPENPSLLEFSVPLNEAEKVAEKFENGLFDYQKVLYTTIIESNQVNDRRATDYEVMMASMHRGYK